MRREYLAVRIELPAMSNRAVASVRPGSAMKTSRDSSSFRVVSFGEEVSWSDSVRGLRCRGKGEGS